MDKLKLDKLEYQKENIDLGLEHLRALNMLYTYQKGDQVPIFDDTNTQVAVEVCYNIELTSFGKSFTSVVIPNNLETFSDIKTK